MQKILEIHRPTVLCEYAIENYDFLYDTLIRNNYNVYDGDQPELLNDALRGDLQNILDIPF